MSIELICEKYDRDIALYFIDSWDFYYNKTSKNTPLSITSLKSKRKNKDPFRYMGLIPENIDVQPNLDMSVIKRHLINNEILISKLESYYCPWHRGYMETHIPHCFAIVEYTDDGLICIDKYLNADKHAVLPASQLSHSNGITFYKPAQSYTQLNMKLLFNEISNDDQDRREMFDMMEIFKDDLEKAEDSSLLFDYPNDLYLCNIARTLKFLADGRIQLGYLLERLCLRCEASEDIVWIYKMLYHCGDLWNIINTLIFKIFYNQKRFERDKPLACRYLSEIIDTEKKVFNMVKRCI